MTPPPPLALRVLGNVDLRLRGAEVRPVLAQPKRLALFLYLALERPGAFHRRDTLLGLFWPESTDAAARASLRQAIRYLRRALGEELLLSRGEAEIGLADHALDCDALDFRRRLAQGDDAGALALYGGELLPGLNASASPELEQWLDWERQRYRQQALQAALRLVDGADAADDLPAAIEAARRALELEPTDEAVAGRLMRLLDRAGHRAGALAVHDQLVARLREAFELDPSPEIAALVASLRKRAADPPTADPVGADGDAGARAARDQRARRVLVAVFENATGDPSLDVLGRMTADWVAQGLAQVPELEVVPPTAAIGSAPAGPATAWAEQVRGFAQETGAGTIVSGTYYLERGTLRFHARITDTIHGHLLRSPEPVAAPQHEPLVAITALRHRLVAIMAPLLTPRSAHVKRGSPPPSYEAYREYMAGLERFVRGDWRGALPHYRRAAELGEGYALPRLVGAITHWNLGELDEARAVVEEAGRSEAGMSPFEREILAMVRAWLSGDWVAAYRAESRQAELAPGSIPSFGVAQEARRLNRPAEAVDVLTRLEPERGELRGWVFYWLELAIAQHLLGDHEAELATARRALGFYPDHAVIRLVELRALAALGRVDALQVRLDDAVGSPHQGEPRAGTLLRESALQLQAHGHAGPAAAISRQCRAWWQARPVEEQGTVVWRREMARAAYLTEDWDAAEAGFSALAAEGAATSAPARFEHGYLQGQLDEGYLAVLAVRRGDALAADRWCRVLAEMRRPFLYGGQWFWLAAVAALRGDREQAVAQLRRAFAAGMPMEIGLHQDPHLVGLRGFEPFDTLMRPKG